MKVDYMLEKDSYTMVISQLTGDELDSIRILLLTAAQYGKGLSVEELGLQKLIQTVLVGESQ